MHSTIIQTDHFSVLWRLKDLTCMLMFLRASLIMSFPIAMARPWHSWRIALEVENTVRVHWHKDLFLDKRGTSDWCKHSLAGDFVKEQTQQEQQHGIRWKTHYTSAVKVQGILVIVLIARKPLKISGTQITNMTNVSTWCCQASILGLDMLGLHCAYNISVILVWFSC